MAKHNSIKKKSKKKTGGQPAKGKQQGKAYKKGKGKAHKQGKQKQAAARWDPSRYRGENMDELNASKVHIFLDMYKQLEDALEDKYRHARRRCSSVVFEFTKDEESAPIRDKLNVCRELRNLLTHNANLQGVPVAEPSGPLMEAMQEVLDFVRRPPLALEFATKGEQVMRATSHQKVLRVMELMEKNGYSHVPVMKDGRFYGVFSVGAVFRYVLRRRGKGLDPEATIKDLKGYLAVEEHTENYEFVPADASYIAVRQRFELPRAKNKRVAVIFITQDGKPDQPLLGMLTPGGL